MKIEELNEGHRIEIDHEVVNGVWEVQNREDIDLGVVTIPTAAISRGDSVYVLVGDTNDVKPIEIREVDDLVLGRVDPDDVTLA